MYALQETERVDVLDILLQLIDVVIKTRRLLAEVLGNLLGRHRPGGSQRLDDAHPQRVRKRLDLLDFADSIRIQRLTLGFFTHIFSNLEIKLAFIPFKVLLLFNFI